MNDTAASPVLADDLTALMLRLNMIYQRVRAEGRGLDALDLIAARDTVEQYRDLHAAVRGHRFDTEHIHGKGVYPRIRLADQMLYEAAGLDRVPTGQENTDSSPFAPTPPPSGGAASPRVHAEPPKHVVPGDNSDTGGGP